MAVVALGSAARALTSIRHYDRSHRLLQEKLAEVQDDLQNADLQNQQLNTQIVALMDQVATKDQAINSLQAEAESLRNSLAQCGRDSQEDGGHGHHTNIINVPALPPDVNAAIKGTRQPVPRSALV